ncbi:MAG: AAA family ATPase [Clostridia bacterium]|nr:AAA family ATPase [Clostridia bacterium]
MKLISCHINRFGAIADKDYRFDPALNGVLGENGAGKTTLAAFLSAMLYGLPGDRVNAKDLTARKHYCPFGGGSFGGSLIFESDSGDKYRIERTFDEKSDTRDELTVYKNDREIACENPGEELFGVDEDAFTRTVFLSADTLDPEPGKTIVDRLCEAVSTAPGGVPAKKAVEALNNAAKKIVPERGARSSGELFLAKKAAADIEDELRAARDQAKLLPGLKEERAKAEAERKDLDARKLWGSYDDLLSQANAAEKRLAESDARFQNGVPDETSLADAEQKIFLRDRLTRDAETPFVPTSRQAELAAKFETKRPDEAALSEMESKAQAIREAQAVTIPVADPQNPSPEKPKNAGWLFPVAAIGGLLFLAGLILLILSMTVPGAILLGVGVFDLGAAAFIMIQGKVTALEKTIAITDPGGAERARRMQLDADLSALLAPYGYSSGDGALAAFAELKRDLDDLAALEKEKANAAEKCAEAKEKLALLDGELTSFFAGYGSSCDAGFRSALNALRDAVRERQILRQDAERAKENANEFAKKQGLTERPTGDPADPEKLDALKEHENQLLIRIHAAEKAANEVPELEDALDRAEERIETLKERYARLTAARDLLARAQEDLVSRYVDPVKTSFTAYADALSSFLGKKVSLDAQFNLTYEEAGAYRSYRHLSDGEKTVAALCLRMALADNLYEGKEQPPLILDDPLVHLDENNLKRAIELLHEVAKKRQIVCLTCHPSRAV